MSAKPRTIVSREGQAKRRRSFEKSAGALVFHRGRDLEFLLIRSTYWEFPKGLIEVEESETAAAVREVCEESGLAVELIPRFREELNYFYRREGALIQKQVVHFLAEAVSRDVVISFEHSKAEWCGYAEALAQLRYSGAREVLKKAMTFLSSVR